MKTAKQEVRDILEQIPDDASLKEIQYHIYVCQKVAKADLDVAKGLTLSQAEVENRMARWLAK